MHWLLVFACSAAFVFTDSLSAHWGKNGGTTPLILVLIFAPLGYLLFAYVTKVTGLAVGAAIVNTAIVIGGVLVGLLLFGEVLTSRQILGLIFAFIAIILMS